MKKLLKFASLISILFILVATGPCQTAPHPSVQLQWTASPDAATNPTLTYAVHRQVLTTPTSTCNTASMVTIPGTVSTLTYTDTNVTIGSSYCYAITAELNGNSSAFSNTATATIPVAPPAGLIILHVN